MNPDPAWSAETLYRYNERIAIILEGSNLPMTGTVAPEILKIAYDQACEVHAEEQTHEALTRMKTRQSRRWNQ